MGSCLGIIAGGGRYPLHIVRQARKQDYTTIAIAYKRVTLPSVISNVDNYQWLAVGQLKATAQFLLENNVDHAIMAGGIPWNPMIVRPRLDHIAIRILPQLIKGDDQFLRAVALYLEDQGIPLIGPQNIARHLLASQGILAGPPPSLQTCSLAQKAFRLALDRGRLDKGQAVLVGQHGHSYEDLRGTDHLLKKAYRSKVPLYQGGVLAKVSKSSQDLRFDLPTIGPPTVAHSTRIGLSALIIQTQKTIILDKNETFHLAKRNNFTILSVQGAEDINSLQENLRPFP